ncbi:MAG TPA: hypothetical protein PKO06_14080 [Candidatus Ozemobacteraceae bacterium]|nr:hypothetical protein [Candidatus Ozemobacteraceae bacterium]
MSIRTVLTTVIISGLTIGSAFAGTCPTKPCAMKKAKMAIVKTGDALQDKTMGAALKAKKTVTGKQTTTFVKGHYRADGSHVKGHQRKLVNPVNGPSLAAKAKKQAIKAGDSVQNGVMDTGVAAKKAITGKKNKTFVKGHFKADGSHVKGHFRATAGK